MRFRTHGYRHAAFLFAELDEYATLWDEIADSLHAITDEMIIQEFESEARHAKSISQALNRLIKGELTDRHWRSESYIFADEEYGPEAKGTWRLDFAKDELSVEVAFNHRSDIAWNLIKPTLASELNHVQKAIQTSGGVIITATQDLKRAGGFDNACGTFEDYVQYLKPLRTILPAPLAIIGLEPPESFDVKVVSTGVGNTKMGVIRQAAIPAGNGAFACPRCGCAVEPGAETCPSCERLLYAR